MSERIRFQQRQRHGLVVGNLEPILLMSPAPVMLFLAPSVRLVCLKVASGGDKRRLCESRGDQ